MDFSICNEYIRELGTPQIEMGPAERIGVIFNTIFPDALNDARARHGMGLGIEREVKKIDRNYFRAMQLAERLTPEEKCRAEKEINRLYKEYVEKLERLNPGSIYGNQYV